MIIMNIIVGKFVSYHGGRGLSRAGHSTLVGFTGVKVC